MGNKWSSSDKINSKIAPFARFLRFEYSFLRSHNSSSFVIFAYINCLPFFQTRLKNLQNPISNKIWHKNILKPKKLVNELRTSLAYLLPTILNLACKASLSDECTKPPSWVIKLTESWGELKNIPRERITGLFALPKTSVCTLYSTNWNGIVKLATTRESGRGKLCHFKDWWLSCFGRMGGWGWG